MRAKSVRVLRLLRVTLPTSTLPWNTAGPVNVAPAPSLPPNRALWVTSRDSVATLLAEAMVPPWGGGGNEKRG